MTQLEAFEIPKADKTCKDCEYLFVKFNSGKKFFKCKIKGNTNGSGTDIRLKTPACGKFKEKEKLGEK